ncbi:C39 family peptidase [Deinococcus radiophilus]|uniref:Tetratricopeptide repeat protein n=1 Tax=Deinococcus radiophilus TaxID=32062 RepID=A0A3S0JPU1_9DEIO|nr:C39 family peptidase [Deinococcus radiophilus]RTR26505.1 tetratricopeptide repeat protein [Deinococcus radiophilus]
MNGFPLLAGGLLITAALALGLQTLQAAPESAATPPPAEVAPAPALPATEPLPATSQEQAAPTPDATEAAEEARSEVIPTPEVTAAEVSAPPTPTLPASASLPGLRHEYQRLNNCGPATLGTAMSVWGTPDTQYDIAPAVRPAAGDVNVTPAELAAYARAQGLDTHLAPGGSIDLIRGLLSEGIPVIVHTWFVTDDGGMGHFRVLTGYDDAAQKFLALDSYLGPLGMDYAAFDELWRTFGRTYLAVYPPEQGAAVTALLGDQADPQVAKQSHLEAALAEAQARDDAVGWLTAGQAALNIGDARMASLYFDRAFAAAPNPALDPTRPSWVQGGLPWRTLWYTFGPLEAYTRTARYADVLRLSGNILRDVPSHEEAHYWRGRALAGLGRTAEARAAYTEALRLRPQFAAAQQALARL